VARDERNLTLEQHWWNDAMKGLLSFAALAAAVNGAAVDLSAADAELRPLDVTLEMVGNSMVKARVKNIGASPLKLFKTGSLLGEAPIERAEIFQEGMCPDAAPDDCGQRLTTQIPASRSTASGCAWRPTCSTRTPSRRCRPARRSR
jgi:hypothetical protein